MKPWIPIEDLMGMSIHERVSYIRRNLQSTKPKAPQEHMSHADFAKAVGSSNEKVAFRWEATSTPKRFAARIAALTPYPAAALGATGETELVRETLGSRLRALEDRFEKFVLSATERLDALEEDPAKPGRREVHQ